MNKPRRSWMDWMEWDRMQQEVRGKFSPMAMATMEERWGTSQVNIHATVGRALTKCRNHMKPPSPTLTREIQE